MKRKADVKSHANGSATKRRVISDDDAHQCFRQGLFAEEVSTKYSNSYKSSEPYKHGVIQTLMDDELLRSVRSEILREISFTPKETDIYKIHQSGDLANLDGLEESALARLPSVLKLRDALYSSAFRKWISHVGNSGPLSGKKTDMAINVYTPGCHLLCHDDVIGSRRLSYMLYLTDPDKPWKPEWGGALRLYPTQTMKGDDGTEVEVPSPEFSLSIPPSWNQLSFFTIQPGHSFHDVEEVYRRAANDTSTDDGDGGRMRMAISGWFHIPQEGEEGYEEGLEEKLAERSSLTQLQQSKADQFDLPQQQWRQLDIPPSDEQDAMWTEADLEFLVEFLNPSYLVPDTLEELSEIFTEASVITLTDFLHPKFAAKLKEYISSVDSTDDQGSIRDSAKLLDYKTARPPHKHRYLYRHSKDYGTSDADPTPFDLLLDQLFPCPLFARWLQLLTNLTLTESNVFARRFRRGLDYTLASGSDEEGAMLEISLGITPTEGWGGDDGEGEDVEDGIPAKAPEQNGRDKEDFEVGGYEVYMIGDDEDENVEKSEGGEASGTGAGHRGKSKSDPAVYKSSAGDEDDGVAFSMPACWNTLSIVMRDPGLLKFVKYVSASAKGDRWDVTGTFRISVSDAVDEDEEAGAKE